MIIPKYVRFFNLLIDFLFIKYVLVLFGLDLYLKTIDLSVYDKSDLETFLNYRMVFIYIPYYFILETLTGKTLGKFITGTRVVTNDGFKVKPGAVLIRTLIRSIPFLDAISFLIFKEGLHDKHSDTKVIYQSSAVSLKFKPDQKIYTSTTFSFLKSIKFPKITFKVSMKSYKWTFAFSVTILLLLLCTNPSRSDFSSFMHWKGDIGLGREKNFLVCSIYSIGLPLQKPQARYFAIMGNFYEIK